MNKVICLINFYLTLCVFAYPQSSSSTTVSGKLINKYGGEPIARADISVIGISQSGVKTSSSGEFELDIGHYYKEGRMLKVFIYHPNYGSHIVDKIIGSYGVIPLPIKLVPNNKLIITGTVKDLGSRRFIPGIEVGISSNYINNNTSIHKVKTNTLGQYFISIPKSFLSKNIDYVELILHDPNSLYFDTTVIKNIQTPVEIPLRKKRIRKFMKQEHLNSYREFSFQASKGDIIKIAASGHIKVGNWVGTVDPEGKSSGPLNIPIPDGYDIEGSLKHGSLMYKVLPRGIWQFCGRECQINIQKSGLQRIALDINDKIKTDNRGAFQINIEVK